MKIKKLYQTLEDRGNPDEIESDGPYKCSHKRSWLGVGYYFWDTFIDLAHWWGHQGYGGNYIICEAICHNDSDKIFDLVGNTEHIQELSDYHNVLQKIPEYKDREMTVSFLIEHMKKTNLFEYDAIRSYPINSINKGKLLFNRIPFNPRNPAYLDLSPAIQLCLLNKEGLNLRNYKIIYPENYSQDFTI